MTTFVLKKYEDQPTQQTNAASPNIGEEKQKEELTISVVGSISEIVAKALYKAFARDVNIEEVHREEKEEAAGGVKAISTEDINLDPLKAFNGIGKDDVVFIHNSGFKTSQEEWFLTNIGNKTENVFYTVESFISHIKQKLNLP